MSWNFPSDTYWNRHSPAFNFGGWRNFPYKSNAPKRTFNPRKSKLVTKQQLNRAIKGVTEKKYFITQGTAVDVSYDNPVLQSLTLVTQGDSDTTRDGDKIHMRSISVIGYIVNTTTQVVGSRLIIFQWLGQDVPGATDIIVPTGGSADAYTWVRGHYNHDHRHLFRILYDRRILLGGSTNANLPTNIMFSAKLNIGLLAAKKRCVSTLQFQAGGTTADAHVYLLCLSSVTDASGIEPDLTYESKFNYSE